jgi:hypothetical protein
MYCPNCGAANSTEQNFCRSCGLRLEEFAEALLSQRPSARSSRLARRDERIRKVGRVSVIGLAFYSVGGVAAAIYQIFRTMILSGTNIAGGIFVIVLMVFVMSTLASVLYTRSRRRRLRLQDSGIPQLPPEPAEVASALLDQITPDRDTTRVQPPSITEASTRHLK